jgi:uncharacterized membrane protein YiaA
MENVMAQEKLAPQKPTAAFIGASWLALLIGVGSYLIGLWNSNMQLNEQGYYFTLLLFGLYSAISVQKVIRDRAEGIAVTGIYYGISWFCVVAALILLAVGLWNAELLLSEKGFYGVSMAMALFSAAAVQKNVRDLAFFEKDVREPKPARESITPAAPYFDK